MSPRNDISALVKNIKDIKQRLNEKKDVLKEYALNLTQKVPEVKGYETTRKKPCTALRVLPITSVSFFHDSHAKKNTHTIVKGKHEKKEENLNATTTLVMAPSLESSCVSFFVVHNLCNKTFTGKNKRET